MSINPTKMIGREKFNDYNYEVKDPSGILMKFPKTLGNSDHENEPAILFKFHNPIPGVGEPESPHISGSKRFIGLPIPAELPFSDSYAYEDSGSLESYGNWIASMAGRLTQGLGNVLEGGIARGDRLNAYTKNSKAAITFKSPEFRTYSFSWDLIPRDAAEAEQIFTIIKMFRIAAASSFEGGEENSTNIKYPDLVSFVIVSKTKFAFPSSYACFIEGVKYSPVSDEGQILFYNDGHPVGWKLELSLKESMYLDKREISASSNILGF